MKLKPLFDKVVVKIIEEKEEKRGNVFIIRPQQKSAVGRVEKDKEKLVALYEEGYHDAEASYDAMRAYLEKETP